MFSKQVIVDVVTLLPNTHADLDMYLIRQDLDGKISFEKDESIPKKIAKITKFLIVNQGIVDNYGNDIVTNIIEDCVRKLIKNPYAFRSEFNEELGEFKNYPNLYKYLRFDGYDIDFENGKLTRNLPAEIEAERKEDFITVFLEKYKFIQTKGHLQQAKGSFLGNNYAALNSQLRAYTESLLIEMAVHIKNQETSNTDIANIIPTNATTAMQVLIKAQNPILDSSLNEWSGDGKGYIQAFWARLHPQGCHPGLPDIDEVSYRYQLVLLNTYMLAKRFENSY